MIFYVTHVSRNKSIFFFFFGPASTNSFQRKRKTYDANDLLALSIVSIIVCIYSLGKKFYCTNFKTAERELILSFGRPFNEKMHEQRIEIWRREKAWERFFNTFN